MSNNLEKESEVTIEVSKEYAKAMDIMADLYGISTSDFLSKALNGELDNMKMKRLPTPAIWRRRIQRLFWKKQKKNCSIFSRDATMKNMFQSSR